MWIKKIEGQPLLKSTASTLCQNGSQMKAAALRDKAPATIAVYQQNKVRLLSHNNPITGTQTLHLHACMQAHTNTHLHSLSPTWKVSFSFWIARNKTSGLAGALEDDKPKIWYEPRDEERTLITEQEQKQIFRPEDRKAHDFHLCKYFLGFSCMERYMYPPSWGFWQKIAFFMCATPTLFIQLGNRRYRNTHSAPLGLCNCVPLPLQDYTSCFCLLRDLGFLF